MRRRGFFVPSLRLFLPSLRSYIHRLTPSLRSSVRGVAAARRSSLFGIRTLRRFAPRFGRALTRPPFPLVPLSPEPLPPALASTRKSLYDTSAKTKFPPNATALVGHWPPASGELGGLCRRPKRTEQDGTRRALEVSGGCCEDLRDLHRRRPPKRTERDRKPAQARPAANTHPAAGRAPKNAPTRHAAQALNTNAKHKAAQRQRRYAQTPTTGHPPPCKRRLNGVASKMVLLNG